MNIVKLASARKLARAICKSAHSPCGIFIYISSGKSAGRDLIDTAICSKLKFADAEMDSTALSASESKSGANASD